MQDSSFKTREKIFAQTNGNNAKTGQPICGCQLESGSAASTAMLLGLPHRLSSAAAAAAAAGGLGVHAAGMSAVGLGLGLGLYNPYAAAGEASILTPDQSSFYAAAAVSFSYYYNNNNN